jgi:hypothetical protein
MWSSRLRLGSVSCAYGEHYELASVAFTSNLAGESNECYEMCATVAEAVAKAIATAKD